VTIGRSLCVVDRPFGRGTGRHLAMLGDRLRIGVGVDYEHSYVIDAHRRAGRGHVHFVTGDATAVPTS
jgi:hypothetical protein